MFIEEQKIHNKVIALANRQIKCEWKELKITFLTDGEVTATFKNSYINTDNNEELQLDLGFELFKDFNKLRTDMIKSGHNAWHTSIYLLKSSGDFTFKYDESPINIFECM
ncbi:MAG: hypothetical protein GY928_35600 [Colwellia sp.]|nr:hypothetical protein [Colwellia sp.]